jgi:hypothetical protein
VQAFFWGWFAGDRADAQFLSAYNPPRGSYTFKSEISVSARISPSALYKTSHVENFVVRAELDKE